jgi:hypothetical protein
MACTPEVDTEVSKEHAAAILTAEDEGYLFLRIFVIYLQVYAVL